MDHMNNLRQIAYSFATILKNAIESEQIYDNGRLVFDWDGDSLDCKIASYKDNDAEDGDINA